MSDAVERADAASKAATKAIADVKATEAKLYPVAENVLKGTAKDAFIHVDDAFPSTLLGIEIEGATEQVTTTGKNLLNSCDSYFRESDSKHKSYLWDYSLGLNPLVLNKPLEAGTYTFSCYSTTGCNIYFSKKPYVTGQFVNFSCNKAVNGDTRFGLKRYYSTFTLTDTYELIGMYSENYQTCFGGMIEKGSTVSAYEPYSDGKPSPSLDFPQEIKVIENPTIKILGKNLLKVDDSSATARGVTTSSKNGVITLSGTATENGYGGIITGVHIPSGVMGQKLAVKIHPISSSVPKIYLLNKKYQILLSSALPPAVLNGQITYLTIDAVKGMTYNCKFYVSVEVYGDADSSEYSPYAETATSFKLPAEHPYLAKLPSGTSDEIVVDRDGNVALVARVGIDKDVRKVGDFRQGEYYSLETNLRPFASPDDNYAGTMLCSALRSKTYATNNEGIYRTWTGVYVRDTSGRTKDEIQAEVDKNAPLTVVGPIPTTRYPLGKIEMPKAQDSIVNVWTDAEVTPRTGIEYTRDVNIVVANLESAIASIS